MTIKLYATTDSDSLRPYMPVDVAYLLPASSWARPMAKIGIDVFHANGIPPVKLPSHVTRTAADCGGFVATFRWGGFPFFGSQYVEWCESIGPSMEWAAMIDLCCENEITSADGSLTVAERQAETTRMATLFWEQYMHVPWSWAPTIQGWDVSDYVRHAEMMAPLIREMQSFYFERPGVDEESDGDGYPDFHRRIERNARDFRVGLGTLCRRASPSLIREIVEAVAEVLPGVPLHLWGVKLAGLSRNALPSAVVSVDSAAWNQRFGGTITQHERERVEIYKQTGRLLTQREHLFRFVLPQYMDRFERQVNGRRFRRVGSRPRVPQ